MPRTGWAPSFLCGEVPGPGTHADPPSHLSRITLAGSELSLVQVALGQLVRLFCPDDSSLDPHARWQKDGRPISSARCVCSLHSPSDLLGRAGECGATAPLIGARLIVASGAQSSSAFSSFRHQLQPDGSLVISPLRAEDTGTYSCGSTRPDRGSQKIQLRITGLCPHPPAVGLMGPGVGYRPGGPGPGGLDTGGLVFPWAKASWWQGPHAPAGLGQMCCPSWPSFLHWFPAGPMAHPSFHPLLPTAHPLLLLAS